MRKTPSKSKTLSDDNPFSLSLGDLMAGLLLIFILLLSFVMLNLAEETSRIDEIQEEMLYIFTEYVKKHANLYKDLNSEFENDLPKWNAELDKKKLSVRFKEPRVLFEQGEAEVKFAFKEILDDFFPRYINILLRSDYIDDIAEIRIEGHTSTEWSKIVSPQEAYILNMELSQDRTRNVLQYVLQIPAISNNRAWIQKHLTANGLSSSKLVTNNSGETENKKESRRVEFRVRTDAEKQLEEINEHAKQYLEEKP